MRKFVLSCIAALLAGPGVAFAQATGSATGGSTTATPRPAGTTPADPVAKPDSLVLYFDLGSSTIRPADRAILDQASRLYRDGRPIVMIVSGSTDAVGSPAANLLISQSRAEAVLRGLVARGIPAERFQLLAKGESEPAVPNPEGGVQPQNRRAEIHWR